MVQVPNDSDIPDKLRVGHEPAQELAAVEGGQRGLLVHLQLHLLHRRYDGYLHDIGNCFRMMPPSASACQYTIQDALHYSLHQDCMCHTKGCTQMSGRAAHGGATCSKQGTDRVADRTL